MIGGVARDPDPHAPAAGAYKTAPEGGVDVLRVAVESEPQPCPLPGPQPPLVEGQAADARTWRLGSDGPVIVSGFVSWLDRPVPESTTLARDSRTAGSRMEPEKTAVTDAPGANGVTMHQVLGDAEVGHRAGGTGAAADMARTVPSVTRST
jgi:hypothetical protein